MSQQSSGSPALRFGALFGVGWGVLLIANFYVSQTQSIRLTGVIALILSLVVYLVPGILASSQTGKVPTGLLAGLFTGLFSALVNLIGVIVILFTDTALVDAIRNQLNQTAQTVGSPVTYSNSGVIGIEIGVLVFGLVAAAVVGLGMGALGGVIGKSRAPQPQTPYQESMYPGYPPPPYGAPGYPQYPQGQMPGAYPPPPPPGGYPPPPTAYPPSPEQYTPGQGNWPTQPPQDNPPQGNLPQQ
jgi:hypothetical protein